MDYESSDRYEIWQAGNTRGGKAPVSDQSDAIIMKNNFAASRLHEIWG